MIVSALNIYYMIASQGGRYTKHIYIGSQRIVSKLGDLASYGQDPRRIPYAGTESDAISVDYDTKYALQQQVIKDNYEAFEVPYNGKDNNDYVNGQSFCCEDDTPKAMQTRAGDNFHDKDAYEKMQFYYHPDHLGSSSYITNLDGEVSQHIEYVPFGEVFIEERNNTWNTPYLFNAKELDEETGMYYYGARYYEPRLSLWMSVDPISNYDPRNEENYLDGEHNGGVYNPYNLFPYGYCYQTPVVLVDPNGKQAKAIQEWWERNQMTTRTWGLIRGVGGVLEAAAGVFGGSSTSWTGVGAVFGGLAVCHGSDVAASGFTQMITGNETSSFTSQGLQSAGISKDKAELLDEGIGIFLSVGAGAMVKFSNQAALNAAKANSLTPAQQANDSRSFFKNTRYTDKVRIQMKQNDYHSFPESVRAFESAGTVSRIKGGDGIIRTKLSIPGAYNGREGFFEFIKEPNGDINHRLFKKN